VVVYGLLLLGLCVGWMWGVGHRSTLIAEVLRDRNALYRIVDDDKVENSYTLKIVNKEVTAQRYRISLLAPHDIELSGGPRTIAAAGEEVLTLPLTLSADEDVEGKTKVTFVVESIDGRARQEVPSSFFGPSE